MLIIMSTLCLANFVVVMGSRNYEGFAGILTLGVAIYGLKYRNRHYLLPFIVLFLMKLANITNNLYDMTQNKWTKEERNIICVSIMSLGLIIWYNIVELYKWMESENFLVNVERYRRMQNSLGSEATPAKTSPPPSKASTVAADIIDDVVDVVFNAACAIIAATTVDVAGGGGGTTTGTDTIDASDAPPPKEQTVKKIVGSVIVHDEITSNEEK